MRSLRTALLFVVLLGTLAPLPAHAAPAPPPEPAAPAAPTASSAAVFAAGSGSDLLTDVTGYFVAGGGGARYTPVAPERLMDTRFGNGLSNPFATGVPRVVQIAGRGSVPATARAVTVNVTVTGQTSSGYVSVGPTMSATPTTSTLNFPTGDTRANNATVALDGSGRLALVFKGAAGSRAHLIVDVTGYYAPDAAATYTSVPPARIVDTRVGNGLSAFRFQSGVPRSFRVATRGGVPLGAVAVSINVTMLGQTTNGYVTVGPTVAARPATSTVNAPKGDTRANGATVALDAAGMLSAVFVGAAGSAAHLIIDVTGYYLPGDGGASFVPLDPQRVLDTRSGTGLSHLFASALPRAFQIAGVGAVPGGVVGVTGNVTVVNQTSAGYVSVGPAVAAAPTTSTINFPLGDTRANGVTVGLDGSGRLAAVFRGSKGQDYPSYDARYHNAWEMLVRIRDAEVGYPGMVDVFAVGKSYQGRPIWGAKVSDNVLVDENEPEVLLDALHHAREHLTIEQILDTFGQLTSGYNTTTRIRNIVNAREVWFIFALNPDGWDYDLGGSPYRGWRKNRQPKPTDLNRNYDYRWGCCGGSSGSVGAWNYRGPSAFSAPETRVVRDFVNSRVKGGKQQIKSAISFHTNGELILWPYGYTFTNIPGDMRSDDHRVFVALGRGMASRNRYTAQQSSDLYRTDGDFIDWMYGRHRIFAFTIELYPPETVAKPTDHEPPDEVIAGQNARNREAMLYFLESSGCPYSLIGKSC